ncbi:MAG: hypothetical protein KC519_08635 [Anaerolineae bacterium]|nr:hypothetical protein [Anaerolineae bacterium]
MMRSTLSVRWIVLFVGSMVVATGFMSIGPAVADTYDFFTELTFVHYLEIDAPEQDVFRLDESQSAWRITPEDATSMLSETVYGTATGAEHDPFFVNADSLGPYEAADALDFNLDQWLAASGSGYYTVIGDVGIVSATFENLIPRGSYSLWCSRVALPPALEVVARPCGEVDGLDSAFMADENGAATLSFQFNPLPMTTTSMLSVFMVVYHSDEPAFEERPGRFGLNLHSQLLAIVPLKGNE